MTQLFIESDVREFIRRLPELSSSAPTAHLLMLAARSKKARERLKIKIKDLVFERTVVRPYSNWRERYFDDLYNLALCQRYGAYHYTKVQENVTIQLPETVMGLFATIAPRSIRNATLDVLKDGIQNYGKNSEDGNIWIGRTDVNFFSALHRHKEEGHTFFTFDQDNEDLTIKRAVDDEISTLSSKAVWMQTQTSGGFHTVLDLSDARDAQAMYRPPEGILHRLTLKYKMRDRNKEEKTDNTPELKGHAVLEYQRDSQECIAGTLYCRKMNDPRGEIFFVRILR